MNFQDNVLKACLKNVYFITGTACGGKTTISRALGKKYGILVYDTDEQFEMHRLLSDKETQPSMNKRFRDADEFFDRSVEEYKNWLLTNTREQLDFMLMDLIRLSKDRRILCDCGLTVEEARRISDPSRVLFLLKEPGNIVEEYCNRPDHQDFSRFIHSASDFEKAKAVCGETLRQLNENFIRDVKASEFFWMERKNRSVAENVKLAEEHFGFVPTDDVSIQKVEKDSDLAEKLLKFVENCSWTDAKEHIAGLVRNWKFTDWETMFAAVDNGRVVGMCSVLKTDYYPLPEIFPWISCVFVDEAYRGRRISGKLIDAANDYTRQAGFDRSYIPSEFVGLYEHYGYHYVKEITNYGGGVDHLFVKELK